jgi:uncharacterized protein
MKSKSVLVSAILLFALVLSACSSPVAAPTGQSPIRSMTVTGAGQVPLKPDIGYINIGVHTEKATAAEAVTQNNTDTQKVIDALKGAGVAADDIRTSDFTIWQNTQPSPDGTTTTSTYAANNTVYLTVRDLTKLGNLLDTCVKAGANNINSILFDAVDKTKALTEARTAAVKAARAQAEELAAATGVTLGSIQTISYYDTTPGPVYESKGMGGGGGMMANAAVPINPGSMQINATVTLTFEIK